MAEGNDGGGLWADVEEVKEPADAAIKVPTQGSWADVQPQTHEQAFNTVLDADPDNIAEVQTLSKKLKTPPQFVRENLSHARQLADRPDFENLVNKAPTLNAMSRESYFLAVAKDDIEQLKEIEQVFDSAPMQFIYDGVTKPLMDAVTRGSGNVEVARLTNAGRFDEALALSNSLPPRDEDLNFVQKHLLGFVGEQGPIMAEAFLRGQETGLKAGFTTAAVTLIAGQAGPQVLLPEELITVPVAAVSGYVAGTGAGMFKAVAELEGGLAKFEMLKAGLSEEVASTTGAIVGTVNGLLELTGIGVALTPAVKWLTRKVVKEVSTEVATRATMKTVAKQIGKDYSAMVGAETTTESLQEMSSIIGDALAKEYTDDAAYNTIFDSGPEGEAAMVDARAQVAEIAKEVFLGTLMVGGVISGGRVGLNHRAQQIREKADMADELLAELSTSIEASRLKERSPETFAEYVNRLATDRGRDAEIYLDAQTVVEKLEQAGVDVIQWAEKYGISSDELATAISTGGTLSLNLGTTAANIGTDETLSLFQEDMILAPQDAAKSQVDSEIHVDEEVTAGLQTEYDREQENLATPDDVTNLKQAMLDAGLPKRAADQYSLLLGARANAWAVATGRSSAEWFARHGLTVQRKDFAQFEADQTGDQIYGQDGGIKTESPEFKQFFEGSQVVNEDGSPQVVYHGTNQNLTEFDPDFAAQGVFWFSSDKGKIEAGESGAASSKNIIPVYLSAKNLAGWAEYEKHGLQEIRELGFDGIKLDDDYVIFEPTQIKSVNNRGTFDPNDPNILNQSSSQISSRDLGKQLEGEFEGLKLSVSGTGDVATVNRIIVPEGERGQGTGSEVMERITGWADVNGKTLALTPSTDFGGTKSRIVSFNKKFGFVENKGKNKDFEISETMYRLPNEALFQRQEDLTTGQTPASVNNNIKAEDIQRIEGGLYVPERTPQETAGEAGSQKFNEAANVTGAIHRAVQADESDLQVPATSIYEDLDGEQKKLIDSIRDQESEALLSWSKTEGLFNPSSVGFMSAWKEGGSWGGYEHKVALSKDGKTVRKAGRPSLNTSWHQYLNRLSIHNSLFPEAAYKLLGFMEIDGELHSFLEQVAQPMDSEATQEEINAELTRMGFKEKIRPSHKGKITELIDLGQMWVNDETGAILWDVLPKNVIKDSDGDLIFIDPMIEMDPTTKIDRITEQESSRADAADEGQALRQGDSDPRGAIVPNPGNMSVFLFEKANLSTMLHEIGHLFLFDMKLTAEEDGVMVEEWQAVQDWLGVKPGKKITKAQHEKFARGFESYLREGTAPNLKLRDAFRSFKKWLMSIYRAADALDVEMTDEIRQVFDTMLATEQEVSEAKVTAAMVKMFDDTFLTESGMDDDFIRDYNTVTGRTLDEATEDMDRHRLIGRDERLREFKAQAEKDSWQEPIYSAVYYLSRGAQQGEGGKVGQGIGLNIADFIDLFGQDVYDSVQKVPGLFRTDGARLGQAAAETDFASPQELADQLVNMQKRVDWVAARVIQLEAQYDKQLPAEEAIRNDAAARQLERESKVLATYAKKVTTTRRAMRIWAEQTTAGQTVGKAVEVYRLIQTSRKLRRQAIAAQRDGDYTLAFSKNEQVRMNEELIAVHTKARDQLKKVERRLNGRANPKIALDYRNQLNTLLKRFGLTKKKLQIDEDTQALAEFLNSLLANNDEMAGMYAPAISGWLASDKSVPYKELTWQELRDVADLADFLYGRGKQVLNDFLSDQKTVAGELALEAVEKANKTRGKKIFKEGSVARWLTDKTRGFFAGTDQLLWIFRAMDGYTNTGPGGTVGVNERSLWYRITQAGRDKALMMQGLTEKLKPHLDVLVEGGASRPTVFNHVRVPDLMLADGRSWTWERIVMVAANMGNEGNIERLANGFDMTVEELTALTSVMTEAEMKAVQGIIDVIDSMFPDIDAVHRRLNHFGLQKVEAAPVIIEAQEGRNVNGTKLPARPAMSLRGGYFPLKYDRDLSLRSMAWAEREDILNSTEAVLQTPAAKSGFTKARTGSSLPVDLSFNVIAQHVHDSVQFITHAEAVKDVDRVTQNKDYQTAAIRSIGKDGYLMIRPGLKYTLRPEKEFGGMLDSWIDKERVRAATFVLAWNFRTALLQPTAMSLAIRRIGPAAFGKGLLAMVNNPLQSIKFMQDASPFMLERAKNIDRDLIDARKAMKSKSRFSTSKYDRVIEFGFLPIQMMDALISYPTWQGAYRLGLEKFDGNMEEAILFADDAVRTTSGSGTSVDLSAMQRDSRGWMKLFTMFSSFTMGYGNMQRSSYNAWRNGEMSNAEYIWDTWMTAIFPSIAATTAFAILTTGEPPEPEDLMKDMVSWQFMGLPIARDVVSYGIQVFPGQTSVVRSPALIGTELLGKVLKDTYTFGEDFIEDGDISRKTQKRMAWDVAHLASYTLKIPASKVYEKMMKGIDQIEDGDGTVVNLVLPDTSRK